MTLFNREKSTKFCQSAIDWILLFLVFWIPLSFAFFHEINNVFALNKVEYLRVFVTLAVLLFLAKIFLAGKIKYRFSGWLLALATMLAGTWFVSAYFAAIPAFAFWGNYERQEGFFTFIFYLLFFLLLIFNLENITAAKRYVLAMIMASLFACLYGCLQFFHLDLIQWAETARIFSTFGQPNFFGHFLILVIPFSVYALFFWVRRGSLRILLAILLAAQIFCLLATYSRAAWLGLAAEIFFVVLFYLFWRGKKKFAYGLIVLALIAIGAAASQVSFSPQPVITHNSLSSRIAAAFDFSQGSTKVRLNAWQAAAGEFKDATIFHKFFGYGPDSLSEIFAKRYQPNWALDDAINSWPDRAHNLFLDIILSFGLIGLIVYFLIFLYFFRLIIKFCQTSTRDENFWLCITCLAALIGYFFNNLLSFSDIPQFLYFFLILGLLSFLIFQGRPEKEIKIKLAPISRLVIFIFILILAAIFIFYYNLEPLAADNNFINSIISINNNNCPDALNDAARAAALGGGNSLFYQGEYIQLGLLCYGSLPAADQQSVKNNLLLYAGSLPAENYFYFAKYRANVEALLAENGDNDFSAPAEKDFSALAGKYPAVSAVYEDWADFALQTGRNDEALKLAAEGLNVLPLAVMAERGYFTHRPQIEGQEISFYLISGSAEAQKNNSAAALAWYEKVIAINPSYPPVYKNIADVYFKNKNFDKAVFYDEKGYELSPHDSAWPLALGILYKAKGDASSSLDYFRQALSLNPRSQEAFNEIKSLEAPAK
jgi:O-antigen ligase